MTNERNIYCVINLLTSIMRPVLENGGIAENVSSERSSHETGERPPRICLRLVAICEVRDTFNDDPLDFKIMGCCVQTYKRQKVE